MGSGRDLRFTSYEWRIQRLLRYAQMLSTNAKRRTSFIGQADRAEFQIRQSELQTRNFPFIYQCVYTCCLLFIERYTSVSFS